MYGQRKVLNFVVNSFAAQPVLLTSDVPLQPFEWNFGCCQARDEDESGMDDQALRDELMTLLVAVCVSCPPVLH